MGSKVCTGCFISKDYSKEFYASDTSICKVCRKFRANKRYVEKREEIRKQQNEYNKIYARENKAKYNAKISFRKAKLLQATPKWANEDKILEFYKLAHKLTAKLAFHIKWII